MAGMIIETANGTSTMKQFVDGTKIVAGKIKKFLNDGMIVEPSQEDLPRELRLYILKDTSLDGDRNNFLWLERNNRFQAVVDNECNILRLKVWEENERDNK